jgi:hypothetical protein
MPMTKIQGKGSSFKVTISSVLTAIAAVIAITLPTQKMETVETDTLDNADAGIPHSPTGRTEGGEAEIEFFFDPDTHATFTTWLNETTLANMTKDCAILIGSTPRKTWTFTVAGIELAGKIVLNDYVKGSVKAKLSKTVTVS